MTDILDFARGPALQYSMMFFVAGVFWRLSSLFLLPRRKVVSAARTGASPPIIAATAEFFRRMGPGKSYASRSMFMFFNGWVMHVGLALIVFGLGAHIMFIKRLTGFSWPTMPSNLIFLVAVVTLFSLIAALVYRLGNPVLKLISTADDYVSWVVTALPILTGIVATMHVFARYELLLAIHILSICLFLIWFPFGKLMHSFLVFITRAETGMEQARRGVKM